MFLTSIWLYIALFIICCWWLVFDLLESTIWCLLVIECLSINIAGSTKRYQVINDNTLWLDYLLLLLFLRNKRVLWWWFRGWLDNFKETHSTAWSEFILIVIFVIVHESIRWHVKIFILVHYYSAIQCCLLLLHHYL